MALVAYNLEYLSSRCSRVGTMGSLAFDSDVPLSYGSMDEDESSFGATASESAAADATAEDGASQPPPAEPAVEPPADGTSPRSSRSRPRGSRGSRSSRPSGGAQRQSERKWRSGAIPQAPVFEGDVEADPYTVCGTTRRGWIDGVSSRTTSSPPGNKPCGRESSFVVRQS